MQKRRTAQLMGLQTLGAVLTTVILSGCTQLHSLGAKRVSKGAFAATDDEPDERTDAGTVMALQSQATPSQTASAEDIAQANAALSRGVANYHRGDYAAAEQALKEAMVLHPFLSPAHLALGKIYLLRGIAADDHKRLIKGRRMVEMALKLDPNLADAAVCLALFP